MSMGQIQQSHAKSLRIVLVLLPLLVMLLCVGNAQTPAVRTSPADSPFPDVSGAQWTKVEGVSGHKFLSAILKPERTGRYPVVVVLHGAFGMTKPILSVAQDVARAGFLVVFGCWQAGQLGTEGSRICSEATPEAEWTANPASCCGKELIAMARTLPGARADRIGLYGMSIGGYAALWAASNGADVQAVVADAAPASDSKLLGVLAGLTAPLLIMHGTADKVVSVQQSREYEQAAHSVGKQLVATYFDGVGHIVSVQPESQAEARKRAIEFLREHLLN